MQIASSIAEVRAALDAARRTGERVGLVPTMGALHDGHLSLVDEARRRTSCVVMSVFVNPLQFGPGEDYEKYPRDPQGDQKLAEVRGVTIYFSPPAREMYPESSAVRVRAGQVAADWEGRIRPGHFDGVLTVVAKLFNIVRPDVAVFGQKDLQQATLVGAMVRDLDVALELVVAPTIRDGDGLALSSRNRFLSAEERGRALALPRALTAISNAWERGERDTEKLERAGRAVLVQAQGLRVDYLAVIDRDTFRRPGKLERNAAAIGAVRVGTTRLIDNVLLG